MLFDILISMLTGLYSGLIASKYIRYVHIRAQSIQLVKHIEYLHGHDEKKIAMLRQRDLNTLDHLAGDLEGLGYLAAAGLIKDIERTLRDAGVQAHTDEDVERHVDAWIAKMRRHQPAVLPTLQAWKI